MHGSRSGIILLSRFRRFRRWGLSTIPDQESGGFPPFRFIARFDSFRDGELQDWLPRGPFRAPDVQLSDSATTRPGASKLPRPANFRVASKARRITARSLCERFAASWRPQ